MRVSKWFSLAVLVLVAFAVNAQAQIYSMPAHSSNNSSFGLRDIIIDGVSNPTSYRDSSNGYMHFTSNPYAGLLSGSTGVTLGIDSNYNFNSSCDDVYAFADWNRDGDFLDAGEILGQGTSLAGGVYNTSFDVPASVSAGTVRFRFRHIWCGPTATTSSTQASEGVYSSGETEDYDLEILPPVTLDVSGSLTAFTGMQFESNIPYFGGVGPYLFQVNGGTNADWVKFEALNGRIYGVAPASLAGQSSTINVTVSDSIGGSSSGNIIVDFRTPQLLPYEDGFDGSKIANYNIETGSEADLSLEPRIGEFDDRLNLFADNETTWPLEASTNPLVLDVLTNPNLWGGGSSIDAASHHGVATFQVRAPDVRRLAMEFDYEIINFSGLPGNQYFVNFCVEFAEDSDNPLWQRAGGDTEAQNWYSAATAEKHAIAEFPLSGTQTLVGIRIRWLVRNGLNSAVKTYVSMDNLKVNVPAHIITTSQLPAGQETKPFLPLNIEVVGGTPPYLVTQDPTNPIAPSLNLQIVQDQMSNAWVLQSRNNVGPLQGTQGAHTFALSVSDANNRSSKANFSISVSPAPPVLKFVSTNLPSSARNRHYSETMSVSGGLEPYTFSLAGAPSFISIDEDTGEVSGDILANQDFADHNFTVRVEDLIGTVALQVVTLSIVENLSINTATLPDAEVGRTYSQALDIVGGTEPYTFTIVSGNKPAGIKLSATEGELFGVPFFGSEGMKSFRVRVEDAGTQVAEVDLDINVGMQTSSNFSFVTLTSGFGEIRVGKTATKLLEAQGGIAPYTYTNSNDGLPAGMSLTSDGRVIGSPNTGTEGSYILRARVEDSLGATSILNLSIVVQQEYVAPSVVTTTIGTPKVGAAVVVLLDVENGVSPYVWSLVSGSLPSGLTLNTFQGSITGTLTPLSLGDNPVNFTIRVTDAEGQSADGIVGGTIQPGDFGALEILPNQTFPTAVAGRGHFSALLRRAGGVAPFSWTLVGGQLPPGMQVSQDGAIQGNIPSNISGNFAFNVRVVDSFGTTAERALTLNVILEGQQDNNGAPVADGLSNLKAAGSGGGCAIDQGNNLWALAILALFGFAAILRRRRA